MQPTTRYAKSGDVHVAYQLFGDGPKNLVFVPGFISHIENYWDEPRCARWLDRLATFARVVIFDKRGTGLSDRAGNLPSMDQRMDDVRAVMDAAGMEEAIVLGISEGGSLASLFAAHHPERCQGLILYGAFAKFTSWFPTDEALEGLFQYIDKAWGSGESLPMFAPSMVGDAAFQNWWGKFERLGANPGAAAEIMRMNSEIDISDVLPTIQVPTLVLHRTEDISVDVAGGRMLADLIPNARILEYTGSDHIIFVGDNTDEIASDIESFVTGSVSTPRLDRVLATVLFTDIVGSTAKAEAMGDQAWNDLIAVHDKTVRQEFARFRGREVKSLGDGFLATFDGPARAIHCAQAVCHRVAQIGLDVRIGVHTGEVEVTGDDVRGIAVNIASRISDLGNEADVLVSRTVKDLVAGSGIRFSSFGTHKLKGVPDEWAVFKSEV